MSKKDSNDDIDLSAVDDIVSTGAAADSSDFDERLKGVPRILRYAMLVSDHGSHAEQRLVAEIDEVCPRLPENGSWAAGPSVDAGLALAAELDLRAAAQDEPNLRSLADCVRLLCLPTPRDATYFDDHRRVAKALQQAFRKSDCYGDDALYSDFEQFVFGWAALPACSDLVSTNRPAAVNAAILGMRMAEHRVEAAKTETSQLRARAEKRKQEKEGEDRAAVEASLQTASLATSVIPRHHLVVARLSDEQMKNPKLREIVGPLKGVINVALPLVEVPPLHEVRSALLFEFPYAADAIEFALADLVGRPTVRLRPLLVVGSPGGGKTRFARQVAFHLRLPIWHEDASRADGAVFAGTDRRWYSAEPCHPFLAIAQGKIANPLVLIDEIEKAGTRSDYGRLWDCLLGFLESSTSANYLDPALQKLS